MDSDEIDMNIIHKEPISFNLTLHIYIRETLHNGMSRDKRASDDNYNAYSANLEASEGTRWVLGR